MRHSKVLVLGVLTLAVVVTSATSIQDTYFCQRYAGIQTVWAADYTAGGKSYRWFLNPCSLASNYANTTCARNASYFQAFIDAGETSNDCLYNMPTVVTPWTGNEAHGFTGTFTAGESAGENGFNNATIVIQCNSSSPVGKFVSNGPVTSTMPSGGSLFQVPLFMNCAAGPVTTAAPAHCGQYTTCESCTNSNSGTCGFCTGSKKCESGNSNGPNNGNCANGHWRWVAGQCQN